MCAKGGATTNQIHSLVPMEGKHQSSAFGLVYGEERQIKNFMLKRVWKMNGGKKDLLGRCWKELRRTFESCDDCPGRREKESRERVKSGKADERDRGSHKAATASTQVFLPFKVFREISLVGYHLKAFIDNQPTKSDDPAVPF